MSERFEFKPKGVCSRNMIFELNGDVIESLTVEGGCNGNLKGIASLIKGKKIDEVIESLDGICCGPRPTSCPDQIARALKSYTAAR
jgi:uncharacterized protein (TIGR03905 family)